MFKNIARKIKITATVISCLGMLGGVVMGISEMVRMKTAIGVLLGFMFIIIFGFFSWVYVFLFYGFGQLIENTDKICADIKTKEIKQEASSENNQVQNV